MQKRKTTHQKLSPTDVSILLLGETGTGKEVAAQVFTIKAIGVKDLYLLIVGHPRKPIGRTFGHKKGSFTGA